MATSKGAGGIEGQGIWDDIALAGAQIKVVELESKLAEEQSTACKLCSMIILVQLVRLAIGDTFILATHRTRMIIEHNL